MTLAPSRTDTPPHRHGLSPDDLLEVAEGFARSATTWPGLDEPSERCWRTIARTDRFEAWVVAWPVGGAIELHDHGDSAGAVVVATGRLVETTLRVDADARLVADTAPVGTSGHIVFGRGHIHDIVNEGPGPALSVHVYSPALSSMTYYERSPGNGLVPVRTEEYRDGVVVG